MENRPKSRRLLAASWIFVTFHIVFGLFHISPPLAYRVGSTSTTYIVQHISSLGPVWVIAFLTTGLFAVFTLLRRQSLCWVGHLLCGGVSVGYTAALFVGALGDSPHGPLTYPTMSLVITICHAILMHSYGGDR